MKKILSSPLFWFALVVIILFRDFIFLGKIPMPIDTLIGAYLPWLDYKWGYIVGVPVKNPAAADAFATFIVWKKLMADLYMHGIVPLWNKYSFSGTPLLATFHSAVLFPANILFIFPFGIGWGFNLFFACLTAGFSMYLFLKKQITSKVALLVGSLIYALAGLMTTWAQYGTAIWAASLLPLILLYLDVIIVTKKKLYFPLSVLVALLIFAGHVQLFTYAAVISPLYFLYRLKKIRGKFDISLSLNIGIATILGVGLGAIQLLPSAEFFGRSIRGEESYASMFNYGLSGIVETIRLWAADFFGNPVTGNHFGRVDYNEFSSYLGVLSLPLILVYLLSPKAGHKKPVFFIVLFIISLLLAYDSPLSRLIFSLPIPLLTYSSASRIFFITNLSAAVIVAFSLDNLIQGKISHIRLRLASIILISLSLIWLNFVPPSFRSISLHNLIPYVTILTLFIIASFVLRQKPKLFVLLVAIIFCFDLGRYYNKYNTFVPNRLVYPSTPVIDFLREQPGVFRISKENTNLLPANSWIAYKLESTEGYDPLSNSDYAHLFHKLSNGKYNDTISRIATLEHFNQKYISALNVKYILVKGKDLADELLVNKYKPVFTDKSVTIFQNPNVLERAYFIDQLTFIDDKKQFAKVLDDPRFDPTKEAVVLSKPFILGRGTNSVKSISEGDNQVEITTQNEKSGFLVLADSYDPGWHCYINGNKVVVYEVNGALRGIQVPPGNNSIIFKYEPASFLYGIFLSLLSFLLLIIHQLGLNLRKRHG